MEYTTFGTLFTGIMLWVVPNAWQQEASCDTSYRTGDCRPNLCRR
jgi:hypothetical protein